MLKVHLFITATTLHIRRYGLYLQHIYLSAQNSNGYQFNNMGSE